MVTVSPRANTCSGMMALKVSAVPAAMASVTLAEAFRGDADFSATAILATHVLCLVTIPLWLGFAL